ncbi:MAG: hypothetical protein ACJAWS_002637 [Oleiphilaceae bacterium]|jgi:hypothetical protein
MNKTALQDTQRTPNIIRNQIEAVDAETKWAALELMLVSSTSVVALAKKMAKPKTKSITRTISILKTKIVKQPAQKSVDQKATKDTAPNLTKPVAPKKPLSNQRSSQ